MFAQTSSKRQKETVTAYVGTCTKSYRTNFPFATTKIKKQLWIRCASRSIRLSWLFSSASAFGLFTSLISSPPYFTLQWYRVASKPQVFRPPRRLQLRFLHVGRFVG